MRRRSSHEYWKLYYKYNQTVYLQETPAHSDEIWNHLVRNYHFRASVVLRAWTSDYMSAQISSHPSMSSIISAFFLTASYNEEIHRQDNENLFLPLAAFKAIRRLFGPDITARQVSAFVLSRLEYCNSALTGLLQSTIAALQGVQNAIVNVVTPTYSLSGWYDCALLQGVMSYRPSIASSVKGISLKPARHPGTIDHLTSSRQ